MDILNSFVTTVTNLVPTLGTAAAVVAMLTAINWFLKRRWKDNADLQFRFQLIMLALTFAGILAIILALPVNDATRGQLLSLIGILLSAAIALSSTTFRQHHGRNNAQGCEERASRRLHNSSRSDRAYY